MLIHLFNNFHNGDLLFNEPVVRNLCKNNPHHTFVLFSQYNSYIFKDIPNLTVQLEMQYNNNFFFTIINQEHIVFNLWVGALASQYHITGFDIPSLECNIPNYFTSFKKILTYINETYHFNINFDNYSENTYLPKLPDTDISDFLSWKENRDNNNKLVFYYNYLPQSNQQIFTEDHSSFIINLASNMPDCTFIVPKSSPEIKNYTLAHKNLIICEEQFNYKEDITCENLIKNQKILEHCNYSIHFDIGACFYYICESSKTSDNTILYLTKNTGYYNILRSAYKDISKKTILLLSNNVEDAYLKINSIINK